MTDALQLAERLGADTRTLRSEGDVADAFLEAARQLNVTRLILGRAAPGGWRTRLAALVRPTPSQRLLSRAEGFEVTILDPATNGHAPAPVPPSRRPRARTRAWVRVLAHSALATAAAVLCFYASIISRNLVTHGDLFAAHMRGRSENEAQREVLGLLLQDWIDTEFRSLWITATMLIVFGVLLALARISGETAPLLFTALNNNSWFNANLLGGWLGARTAISCGSGFVRGFFLVVVGGFVVLRRR